MTNEYAIAYANHNAATKAFTSVTLAYRARTIGDFEFIAARKAFDAASKIFDAAFAAESEIEESVAKVTNDLQLALI